MQTIDKQTLILAAVSHILMRLKSLDARIGEIEMNTSDILDNIADEGDDEVEVEMDDEECDAAALADQLLDAADEIEGSDMVPNAYSAASQLREIAKELQG
jgi:hypothetical protein